MSLDQIFVLVVLMASLGVVTFGAMRSRQRQSREVEPAVGPVDDREPRVFSHDRSTPE